MLHKMFCSQLQQTLAQPSVRFGELLLAFLPHMEIYAEFIRNHDKSHRVLEDCLQNSSLAGFLENHHPSHDCEAHQLKTLLHLPVTRVSAESAASRAAGLVLRGLAQCILCGLQQYCM